MPHPWHNARAKCRINRQQGREGELAITIFGRTQSRAKPHEHAEPSELSIALKGCRSAFIGIGVMSAMINLLYLTGSFFMLEVYDRVVPSRSVPTLVGLVILAGGLYAAQGVLGMIRGRILVRIGASLDESLDARVFDNEVELRGCGRAGDRLRAAACSICVLKLMSG